MSSIPDAQREPALEPLGPAEMPIDAIARIGRATHGRFWIRHTAEDLGLSQSTLRRWLKGRGAPVPWDVTLLRGSVRRRVQDVLRAVEK